MIRQHKFRDESTHTGTYCRCAHGRDSLSIAALGVVDHDVLGDGKYAGLPLELDQIGGVSGQLHLSGLGPQPGDHATNRTASTKLGQQQSSVSRVVPYPELVHGTPQHFIAAISVTTFKDRIHFQKPPLLEGCDGERDGARVEYV